jgi:hypothetical protein
VASEQPTHHRAGDLARPLAGQGLDRTHGGDLSGARAGPGLGPNLVVDDFVCGPGQAAFRSTGDVERPDAHQGHVFEAGEGLNDAASCLPLGHADGKAPPCSGREGDARFHDDDGV